MALIIENHMDQDELAEAAQILNKLAEGLGDVVAEGLQSEGGSGSS